MWANRAGGVVRISTIMINISTLIYIDIEPQLFEYFHAASWIFRGLHNVKFGAMEAAGALWSRGGHISGETWGKVEWG